MHLDVIDPDTLHGGPGEASSGAVVYNHLEYPFRSSTPAQITVGALGCHVDTSTSMSMRTMLVLFMLLGNLESI